MSALDPKKATALGRLLVEPPKGMPVEIARIIDALAREQATRDHAQALARIERTAETGEAA